MKFSCKSTYPFLLFLLLFVLLYFIINGNKIVEANTNDTENTINILNQLRKAGREDIKTQLKDAVNEESIHMLLKQGQDLDSLFINQNVLDKSIKFLEGCLGNNSNEDDDEDDE